MREVVIYNKIIKIIKKKFRVNRNEIWYKHHPRLDYDSWLYKKKNISCSIYEFDDANLAEIELMNENLLSVYSSMSTSLYYAKKIFKLESYLIDFSNEGGHPSAYKKAYYLAKKFDIPIIKIS